ncbi:MAG: alpha/beta fold hydrolase [Candidatus Hermodarchaeota archaeon]
MFVEIQNVKIYYELEGSGTPIILIHGHGESTYIWRFNIKKLAENFSVYALDLKGFGKSEKPLDEDYSISTMSNLIINFMIELHIEKAILVCHSFAGKIGISAITNNNDRFLGLALLGSAVGKVDIWPAFKIMKNKKLGKAALKRFNKAIAIRTLKRLHHKSYQITEEDIEKFLIIKENDGAINAFQSYFIDFLSEDEAYLKLLEKIQVPTLIIWGRDDEFISYTHGELLNEKLKNSKFEIIENCGHNSSEDQPNIVNQLIIDTFQNVMK